MLSEATVHKRQNKTVNDKLLVSMLRWRVHMHMLLNDRLANILGILIPTTKILAKDLHMTISHTLNRSSRLLTRPKPYRLALNRPPGARKGPLPLLKEVSGAFIYPVSGKGLKTVSQRGFSVKSAGLRESKLLEQEEPMMNARAQALADQIVEFIDHRLTTSMAAIREHLRTMLSELSVLEIEMVTNIVNSQMPSVAWSSEIPLEAINKIIDAPLGGAAYSTRLSRRYGTILNQVRKRLITGLIRGDGIDQMVRQVRPLLTNSLPWQVERLVRTETMRVSNAVHQDLYGRNKDIIAKEMWLATLDDVTCLQCGVLDGNRYNVGEGPNPIIDTHPQCRCLRIPVTKSWRELGLNMDEISPGMRASMDGTVPATTTFKDFFADQDEAFQRRVLGKTRYEMWASGQLRFDQFATTQRIRSIKELNRMIK